VKRSLVALAFFLLSRPAAAEACSVCFGDPKSPMARGVVAGIGVLLAVVVFVLGAIAATALSWARRSKELERSGGASV